jgi:EmrB/QacA subfamily drug resistance transporter
LASEGLFVRPVAPASVRLDHAAVRRIVGGLTLAMFLSALDQTIVATALATIGRDFSDIESLAWVVTAYLLAATAVTPLYGKLSDIHGRQPVLLAGIAIFVVGSLACALAPSLPWLILARGIQGLGGGGLISLAQTIVADAVPPRERGRYQGYFGAVFASASIAGPVLGGVFAEHLHWSLIFWINLPVGLVAFWLTGRALKALPRYERPHRLDIPGAVLMVAAALVLLLALNWGGTRYPWGSAPIVTLLVGSAVLWGLFAWRLMRAPEPFVPLAILRNRVVALAMGSAFFAYGTMIALAIYAPLYFETVLGLTATKSGLALIPFMGGVVIGSTLTGQAMGRIARYKRIGLIGLPLAVAALGLIAALPAALNVGLVGTLLALAGIGLGTALPITTVSIQNVVAVYELGTATGVNNFLRSLGSALLVALYGAILLGGMGGARPGLTLETLAASRSGAEVAHTFGWIFAAAAAGLALSFLFLALMEERPLRASVLPEAPIAPAE